MTNAADWHHLTRAQSLRWMQERSRGGEGRYIHKKAKTGREKRAAYDGREMSRRKRTSDGSEVIDEWKHPRPQIDRARGRSRPGEEKRSSA